MSNIIDSIKVSGVTYEIQGGSITVDPTLDTGSTNPVANSAITTALDAKVNVADNEVSGVTVVTAIGFGEEFAYGKVNKITVKSTVSSGSGTRTVNFYCVSSNGLPSLCTLKYQYSNRTITSITSTSGNFTATLNNGAIDITFSSGYSFNFLYTSDSRFAVYGYMVYDGGQSADVLEGSVGQAITDVAAKIPPTILTDASLSISNSNGNITLRITDQAGSNININRPLYDRKTLKYDNTNGLYVNFYGETAHTVTLNTSNGNYCMIPDVTSSYKDGLDSITVRVNSGYTGSTSSFSWKLNGVDNSGTTYENTYTYDKTNNTVTLSGSSTFNVSVTNDGYYFTFTPTDTNTRIWRFYETSCNIAGIENIYQERYIIDLVQGLTYQYNGQEVIDDIYSKLDTKQTTLTAGTGISIVDNVISATGGGTGGTAVEEMTQAEYDAAATAGTLDNETLYIITDAPEINANEYVSKAENTVSATTIFVDYEGNFSNQNYGENIVRSVTFNYTGDKTSATQQQAYFSIVDTNTLNWHNASAYFNYADGTYTKDDSYNILDVTYDLSIEDFRINISDNYPNCNISNIQFYGGHIKVHTSTIASGQSANVIQTSIANTFSDIYTKNLNNITNCYFSVYNSSNKNIILVYSNGRNSSMEGGRLYLEDLKAENRNGYNYLSSDINIPLGTSGWTEVSNLSENTCQLSDSKVKGFTTFRISGDTTQVTNWNLTIGVGYNGNYTWDYVNWDDNENTFVLSYDWDVFSAATATWDSNTGYLTVSYPETVTVDGEERQTEFFYINSQSCQYGYAITKLEYYAELQQPIKSYVQETKQDLGGMKLVKLTESEYTALVNKDANTLYVVTPDPNP